MLRNGIYAFTLVCKTLSLFDGQGSRSCADLEVDTTIALHSVVQLWTVCRIEVLSSSRSHTTKESKCMLL